MRARAARRVGPSLSNRPFRPASTFISAPGWAGNASLFRAAGFSGGFRSGFTRTASRRSGGGAWRSGGHWGVRVLRRRSRQPLCDPPRARRRIAADGVPAVSQSRARGSAGHAHLAFTLLPDGCRASARITICDGVRDRRGAFFAHARWTCGGAGCSRRAATATPPGHADRPRRLRRVGTARDRRAGAGRPHRRAERSTSSAWPPLAVQAWRPGPISLRATIDREFDIASARKPDKDLDGHARGATNELDVARVQLAVDSVPPGLPRPLSLRGIRRFRRRLAGRIRRRRARVPCGAPVRKLGRVPWSGSARDCRVPAGRPGRREDGGRSAARESSAVITMADRQRSHSKRRPACSCTWRTQRRCPAAWDSASRPTTSALERFLRYAVINTRSDEGSSSCPSTPGQLTLLRILVNELTSIGLTDVSMDEHGYVMGTIPSTTTQAPRPGHRLHRARRHVAGDAGPRSPADRPPRLRRPRSGAARRSGIRAASRRRSLARRHTSATTSSPPREQRYSAPTTRPAWRKSSPRLNT